MYILCVYIYVFIRFFILEIKKNKFLSRTSFPVRDPLDANRRGISCRIRLTVRVVIKLAENCEYS